MTVSTTTYTTTALGNGVTTVFSFGFIADNSSTIQVTYTDVLAVQHILGPGDYTLVINAPAPGQLWGIGGTVTYPISGSPIPTGSSLTITRTVPYLQTVSIGNQGAFYPQAVEQALDLLELQLQQLQSSGGGNVTTGTILMEHNNPSQAISQMTDAGNLTSFEYFPALQDGQNVRVRLSALGIQSVNIAFEYLGGAPPVGNETVGMTSFDKAVTFPGNFSGATGHCLVNPTGNITFAIGKTGSTVGNMTISTGGVFSFTSSGNLSYAIGDYMTVTNPSGADATLANFAWTFPGNLT